MTNAASPSAAPGRAPRDPRLDVWRGIAMLIILVAHIQWNPWAAFIPAKFGPSDAAEMFVFCSGYAAAIAFGGTFARLGFWVGTARILHRCWQIYWAHAGLYLVTIVVTLGVMQGLGPTAQNWAGQLNVEPLLDDTARNLFAFFTLTYVPNYFDILPMYMVILLMVPIVVALQRLSTWAAVAFCLGLYAAAWAGLALPAEPWSERTWFFNPFAWQLLFFTGFALSRGWLPKVPYKGWLLLLALAYVLVMIPLSRWQIYWEIDWLKAVHDALWVNGFKSNQHPLRYLHVLALTYLAAYAVHGRGAWLTSRPLRPIVKVGQQALAAFMTSMLTAWLLTIALDYTDRGPLAVAAANLIGLATVIAAAYVVGWYKAEPWRRRTTAATPAAA